MPGRALHPLETPGLSWRSKEAFEISLHHHAVSLLVQLYQLRHGRVATATPTKTMRAVMKGRCKDRFAQGTNDLLGHSTPYRRESSGPKPPWSFGHIHPPERDRLVGPRLPITHQRHKVLVQIGGTHRDGRLVETCRSPMALHGLEGCVQRVEGDPARERVDAECAWKNREPTSDPP